MCGIFGFWLNRPLTEGDMRAGREGIARLGHRGPDGDGEWVDSARGLYLAHRRLAIIDVAARSDQPMVRGEHVVSYNGEVYNYQELREELIRNHISFMTTGDTEVLLLGWRHWGENLLSRLDAMFAFALFDGRGLILANDPFGEKPLYVAKTKDGIWFASEAGALVETLKLKPRLDDEDMRSFLALGFLPAPRTGYHELELLPPGTVRRYSSPQTFSERRYWQPKPASVSLSSNGALTDAQVDDVTGVLLRSLKRRLRSDVGIGLFLSSGVDSALVGALCARELGASLEAYTVTFPDGVDEAPAAKAIADHLGLRHVTIDSRSVSDNRSIPDQLIELYGTLNDNMSGLSVRQMSVLARDYVKVALSGSGGDELAFGYNKYAFFWRRRNLFRIPAPFYRALKPLDPAFGRSPHWQLMCEYLRGDKVSRFISVKNGGLADLVARLGGGLPNLKVDGGEAVISAREFDVGTTLPGSYLSAIDRGSMRAGLEVRSPFLSCEVFDQVSQINPAALMASQKVLLRRILKRYLPTHLYDLPKRGFVSPIDRYIGRLKSPLASELPLDRTAMSQLWQRRSEPAAANLLLRIDILNRFFAAA
jgi:asparagine synthase (glutamine-hydrolysing)